MRRRQQEVGLYGNQRNKRHGREKEVESEEAGIKFAKSRKYF
jgi:hypothetical protein